MTGKVRMTQWNMAQILLEIVPEVSLAMAGEISKAIDIGEYINDDVPPPLESEENAGGNLDEQAEHPYYQALSRLVGESVLARFGPYAVADSIFRPVFENALESPSIDTDLTRRCCTFLEAALAGEDIVAEAITMMISENFGRDFTLRVRSYAGPRFLESLREFNWLD